MTVFVGWIQILWWPPTADSDRKQPITSSVLSTFNCPVSAQNLLRHPGGQRREQPKQRAMAPDASTGRLVTRMGSEIQPLLFFLGGKWNNMFRCFKIGSLHRRKFFFEVQSEPFSHWLQQKLTKPLNGRYETNNRTREWIWIVATNPKTSPTNVKHSW